MPGIRLLPSGGTLSSSQWDGRHRTALVLLAAHLPALLALASVRGLALPHVLVELAGLGLLLAVGACGRLRRRVRACATSVGLVGASAVLVHVSGGATEAHIHFLLVLAVVAFYEEWVVLGLAVAVSLAHHVGLSLLAPEALFSATAAQQEPFLFAGIHVAAVTAQCLLALRHWRVHERAVDEAAADAAAAAAALVAREAAVREREREQTAREELEAARDAALAASRAKSAFLANTSHEIRTPLNGVLGMTALLLAGPLAPEQRERAELVQRSGQGLLGVVEDVLDLSRTEAGRLEPARVPFDLVELAQDAPAPLQAAAAAAGLRLAVHLSPGLPQTVLGDPARLRQVLVNLLGNAVKFTGAGTVDLHVQEQDGRIRFTVRDTGPGIAPSEQERVFEPFVQGDGSSTRRHGGTGLGLTISRDLVRVLGGELVLDSAPGRGSAFGFALPLEPVAPAAAVPAPRSAEPARPLRLLLAEDSPVNQAVAVGLLGSLGCEVDVVDDGQQALDRLEQDPGYDALLLDIQMPVLDGFDAARAVRAREQAQGARRLPVVALTASAMAEDRDRCRDAGMDGCFSKPFSPEEVLAALQDLVAA